MYDISGKTVSVGDHVVYAVPKPPQATKYAHGIVKSIKNSGTIKIDGTNESFEATKDNPVATIEVWVVDEKGNPKSKTDRVVAKPVSKLRIVNKPIDSAGDRNSTLRSLMSEYNKNAPKGRKVTMTTLTTVFNRGVGAYRTNPSSVRPNVVSAEQWGYGRVKAFLKMLKSGSAPRKPFDQDLLPKEHPLSSKGDKKKDDKKDKKPSKSSDEALSLAEKLVLEFEDFAKTQKDARLYFKIQKGAKGCPADAPYGVVGEKSGVVHGCHKDAVSANKQLAAIYKATDPNGGYKPASKETKKMMETPEQHDKRVAEEKKSEKLKSGQDRLHAIGLD